MSVDHKNTQSDRFILERMRHSVVLLIFLDLLTLGLYSAARSYLVHTELSQKVGRRLFSTAFLHILIVLNLLLLVLRFSRGNLSSWDSSVIMARLGSGLLLITLLLIFRRCLHYEFQLRIRPLPLAIFGFWYLQHRINQAQRHNSVRSAPESWVTPLFVIVVSVALSLALGMLKQYRVSNTAMEPTLVIGDHVLADQLSYLMEGKPQRGDLLVYQTVQDKNSVQVKRLLGLPGDHIGFHGDQIHLNGRPLSCLPMGERIKPGPEAMDQNLKRIFRCEINGKSFTLQLYQEGGLTAIQGDFEVPQDHYFLIGDNLDNSLDSRTTGPIPARNILGRVRMTTISYRIGESIFWQRWFQLL
jgi:signal peptidase I